MRRLWLSNQGWITGGRSVPENWIPSSTPQERLLVGSNRGLRPRMDQRSWWIHPSQFHLGCVCERKEGWPVATGSSWLGRRFQRISRGDHTFSASQIARRADQQSSRARQNVCVFPALPSIFAAELTRVGPLFSRTCPHHEFSRGKTVKTPIWVLCI